MMATSVNIREKNRKNNQNWKSLNIFNILNIFSKSSHGIFVVKIILFSNFFLWYKKNKSTESF